MHTNRFRDRRNLKYDIDLQDAFVLMQIVVKVIKRHQKDADYMLDDDQLAIHDIAKSATDITALSASLSRNQLGGG